MDVVIVCHTEFGYVSNSDTIFSKEATSGVTEGVLNLIKIADTYGAKISFAVCPEVVECFPRNIQHEVGLHIHPGWQEFCFKKFTFFVGDKYLKKNCRQSSVSTLLRDFSYEEQLDMIAKGKRYLESELGVKPNFFVAGRWSLNNNTIKALIKSGFTHDCSASAYAQATHPDWLKLPRISMPYQPDESDYQKEGNLPLLIVPVSQYFPHGNVNPEVIPRVGLAWLKACFLEYYKQGLPFFHICLHSPSMTDDYFVSQMEKLLSFICQHQDIHFKFISEVKKYPDRKTITNFVPYIFAFNKNIFKTFLMGKILKRDKGLLILTGDHEIIT